MIDDLYSAKILNLVANMPRAGRLPAPDASSEKVAKLCGSKITVDVVVEGGKVVDFAQDVTACALGQAAAAILGQNVIGADLSDIELARDSLAAMLKGNGSPPAGRFAELAVLEPVKDYPARHASTLLAFEATVEAIRQATGAVEKRTSTAGAV
ncbi:iron-sulfur cluster assembly scaffold protein [Caulobacter sp. BP25]|uniref:iron-sulfur cluster assembly scaffold protein n=1 Tax=Caulobacter sp. BP25 TaxID=2048900 RepID=UPI000C12CA8C|nr:iron-sulfur cluster assembly scaffold protein [Caulobacter sp. BP25]PHY18156.1 iron-sulfur cluster assembly scaffold protein [Caulobacter sp. BP25]